MKIGHRYVVSLEIAHKTWYPGQGGKEGTANEFYDKKSYDIICDTLGIIACSEKIEELLRQDYGKIGIHNEIGHQWNFVIGKIVYKGEVRM